MANVPRMPVRKAVLPVAGYGTRLLPATKAQPKGMLTVVDKPAVQYQVEEAVAAGIEDVLIVTGVDDQSIRGHFERQPDLESFLEAKDRQRELEEVIAISELARLSYVRQEEQLGLGHAVLMGERHVGNEPFAVLLGDEIIWDEPFLARMIDAHERLGANIIGVMEVESSEVSRYGIADVEAGDGDLLPMRGFVEKPPVGEAPSNLASIGRYVLSPEIFAALHETEPGAGGEIQLTDGIARLMESQPVYACVYRGARLDVGNKIGLIRANLEIALSRDDLGPEMRSLLKDICGRHALI